MLAGSTVSILDRVAEGATESFPWMSRCRASMDAIGFRSSGRGKPVPELQPDTQISHDSAASDIRLRVSTESSDSAVTCARPCFGGSSGVSESTLGSLLFCPCDLPLECPLLVPPCRFEEFEYRNDLIVGENGAERRHSALLQLCTVAGEGE